MKINLGSGFKNPTGFLTIDHDQNTNPDYCLDLEKDTLPFEDNSVEEVMAHHILEHLGDGFFHTLQEIYRVCKNGAIINVVVPHHRHEYFLNDPTHKRPITIDGMALFNKKYNDHCKSINDSASKLGYFYNVDFEIVWVDLIPNPKYIPLYNQSLSDPKMRSILDQVLSECNNVIIETHFKMMVIKN